MENFHRVGGFGDWIVAAFMSGLVLLATLDFLNFRRVLTTRLEKTTKGLEGLYWPIISGR